jgi:hypothetical protein
MRCPVDGRRKRADDYNFKSTYKVINFKKAKKYIQWSVRGSTTSMLDLVTELYITRTYTRDLGVF